MDIWDGETEPMVYHGRTLTSKVSVRDTCAAIMKYAFVASPYPIILSAEIHCGVQQQEQLVGIMKEVFGDHLVYAPADGRPKIEALPSPEDLKYRVLVKAKNLYVSERQGEKEVLVDAESSTTDTSASDSDVGQEIKHEWRKARENEAELIKGVCFPRFHRIPVYIQTPSCPCSSRLSLQTSNQSSRKHAGPCSVYVGQARLRLPFRALLQPCRSRPPHSHQR